MRRLSNREVDLIAKGITPPSRGDIWRARNGWERHVLSSTQANVRYIQVVPGRANVDRDCLPATWEVWARKSGAVYVGKFGG